MPSILDYFNKGQDALLGKPNTYGGTLDEEATKQAQARARMMFAASLLEAGGPSAQPTSLGQALSRGMLAGQQAQQGSLDSSMKALLLQSKLKEKPSRGRLVPIVGADGKPTYAYEQDAVGKQPYAKENSEGSYQPGNYTTTSWAKFLKSHDPADLERYTTPRQDYTPSFQKITRTLPDGSTQQGVFDTRTGEDKWNQSIVPAGQKDRVSAAARAEGTIAGTVAGTRATKSPIAYDTFKTGISSLTKAMDNTATGPLFGSLPAVTAAQQTAEGAEATMAPVLKQLFRDAGEGSFTEGDQALLMKMVPTRKDHPEARAAKIEMIDAIVKAKLGIGGQASAPAGKPKRIKVDAEGNVIGN